MTPTQIRLAAERRERLARINSAAFADKPAPQAAVEAPKKLLMECQTETVEQWVTRHKECWFKIVDVRRRLTIASIQNEVAKEFGITRTAILSPSRQSNIALARQVSMYLSRELLNHSWPEIGRRHGGRDHTTALHAVRKLRREAMYLKRALPDQLNDRIQRIKDHLPTEDVLV